MPVTHYNGGHEHNTRHLIYSRFWHHALFDLGLVNTPEPYARRTAQGLLMGNDGYNKVMFSVSTGLMNSGWAITAMGSRTWGKGYIQGTGFEGYSYFLNESKRINESHQLSLTGFGAPQWHWTRPAGKNGALCLDEWNRVEQYMPSGMDRRRYNPSYGKDKRGEQQGTKYNQYH